MASLEDFSTVGNIYVDNSFTAEATPATSPVTGEALEFGVNAFSDLTGSDILPALPEDGKAAFVTNVARSFDDRNFYFGRTDGTAFDVYVSNVKARNISIVPRTAGNYAADNDGKTSVYIEGSTFANNLLSFGGASGVNFTGDYSITIKNSRTNYFAMGAGQGYGSGEGNAGNQSYGTITGNVDFYISGLTVGSVSSLHRGALVGADETQGSLKGVIENSFFGGEVMGIHQGVDSNGANYKSFADIDITITGSSMGGAFMLLPNQSSATRMRNGELTFTGDITFNMIGSTVNGLVIGTGRSGTGWQRVGWIEGDIDFTLSGSTTDRTYVTKGNVGDANHQNTVTGTIDKGSVIGDLVVYENRDNATKDLVYADSNILIDGATVASFTYVTTINSGGNTLSNADKIYGTENLEITGSRIGAIISSTGDHSGATFNLTFHASPVADTESITGAISKWATLTVDAGAKVRASSIADVELVTLNGAELLNVGTLSGIGTLSVLDGTLPASDVIIVSGLTAFDEDNIESVQINGEEYSYGILGGQYSYMGGNLVAHMGVNYLVNSNYDGNGIDTDLGPKGYRDIDVAQTAAKANGASLVFTTLDEAVEAPDFTADVSTLDIATMFLGTGSGDDALDLDGVSIIIGDAAADVDTADVSIAYANNISGIGFGNVTGTAKVTIDHVGNDEQAVGALDLTGSVIGEADIAVTNSYFDEVKLADQAATAGKLTISSSTIGNVYGGASNLEIDMTGANAIENVFAEGNGASIKLGTSKVTTYMAGLSEAGAAIDTIIYNDGVSAEELIIGGNANQIGKIDATVTGGEVEHLIVGADGDTVAGDIDLNLAGGVFSTVSIADNATVGGKINVALTGGTVDTVNGTFYGLIYGASVSGALDGGTQGTGRTLVVDGYARVASITNFDSIEVVGGTLNVESGDRKADPTAENLINIAGDITNRRAIQAGGIIAEDLYNYGLIGVLRNSADDPGIQLSGNFYSDTFVRTSTLTVTGSFSNAGEVTSVGDITVGGAFANAGQIYIRSSFDKEQSVFSQDGGITLGGVDMINSGDAAFISTGFLTGVKNLTTNRLYVTGGAEINGNITIEAGAEVAFTNKAVKDPSSEFAVNGLKLTGKISMYDTSNLIVSGTLTSNTKTITINTEGDGLIGSNVLVKAEGGLDSWTIAWGEGLTANSYGLVKSATEIMIYSIDELFVSSAFAGYEEGDTVVIDGKNFIFGLNAFATVEDATYFATTKGYTGSTIAIYKDKNGMDVDATGFDVSLYDAKVGTVSANDIYVASNSQIGSIAAATSLVIDDDAFVTIGETIPEGLPIVIDAADGSGARKVLAVDPAQVTIAEDQVSILAPLGSDTYDSVIVGGEVFLKADANIFLFAEGTEIVDGSIDKTTGDALFAGVNAFTVEAEAAAAAKASGGTLFLADGSSKIRAIEGVTDIALVYNGGNSLYGNDANAFVSDEDYSVKIIGATSSAKVYGINKSVTMNGDYTFYMADSVLTSSTSAIYITGNDVNNVVNGDINAELVNVRTVGRQDVPWGNGGWNEGIYLGYGSFGTDSTNPIDINVTLRGVTSSNSGFYGIQTQPSDGTRSGADDTSTSSTPKDQQVRQDINANINIKVYDSVIGGTFTVLNTNNEHWDANGASLLNTYFSSGSITVEVGNSDFGTEGNWRNIRLGASLQLGGKAIQEFNVPNTLHIVATENGTTTRAAYINEWDTLIVDATAQLILSNEVQYSTVFGPNQPLDDAGTLTQIMINMSGYKSGTHNVITAGTSIATDETLSNITVIGDNDLTGQCQLAYAFSADGTQLRGIYVFDKADDMYVNATYDNSISGTKVSGQELLLNYNAFTGFEGALKYADEWGGTIVVTGGAFESQDFHGNNVEVRAATIGTLTMANVSQARKEVTLTVKDGAVIGSVDGSNAVTDSSILEIAGAATIGDVFDFDTVSVKKGVALNLGAVSGAGFNMFADNELSATSVTFNGNEKIVLDVTGYTGKSHAIISTESGITGFDASMVTLEAHDKGKTKTDLNNYSVMVVGNDLVLRNALKSDTYLNSNYTAASMAGGVTLDDGSYLEYGFNAFDDATAAAANLGAGSKFTLTVTGGEIASDIKLGGNNFVMEEGVVNGVVYACVNTADKGSFYSGKTYTVTAGTIGGFDLTAGEGVYVATNSAIKLGEDVTITGNIIGGGDTVITSEGKFTVNGLIMGVSEIVLNADGFLTAGGIDLGSGEGESTVAGTIRVKSVPFTSEEGNRRLIIESDTDIKNAQFVADPGTALYSTGKQVYVVDLTRVYFDPTYTEDVDGTKAANGDTLLWGVNAFSSFTSAKSALITGGTLYVSNANTRIGTDDRLINLVITDSNVPVMISGMTSGDKSFTGADAVLVIENSTFGQDGESWLLNRVTANEPWNHHNTIGGNLYVTINGSTIGGNNNQTTHFIDYLSYTGKEMVFNINDTIIRNDLEFFGDSGPLRDGQAIVINMTNVTTPANKWWRITSGNPGNAGEIIVNIKDSSIGTSGDMRFGVQSNWQWGEPTATTNITFSVEDSYFSGYLTAHSIDPNRTCHFDGEKVLIIAGSSNYVRASVHFNQVQIAATSFVTGSTMALDGGTVVVDGTGYEGPTKTLIWMNTTMSGVDAVTGENLKDGYEVVKGEKAIVISDGVLGNMYYDATYGSAITGVTSAYGDVLIYEGDAEENIANALTDLDNAKAKLTAGNKLYVAASEKELYGTLADEDETAFVDMVVTNGNFSEDGSLIAVAEDGKSVTGNATLEIAGGSIGKAAVTHIDEETGDVIVDEEAVYAAITGSKDSVGGVSEFVLSKVGGIYADVSDFDKMSVTSEARVHGTITVDALAIENTGFLTVDGTLDTQSIHIATEGYKGASKRVLVADALETFDETAITVDEGGQFFLDRAGKTLWLVSTDPGNVYFNTAYDATINGTSFNGDLLFYGSNAFSVASKDAISERATSEDVVYFLDGNFGTEVIDLSGIGTRELQFDGGSVGGFKVDAGSYVRVVGSTSAVSIGSIEGVPVPSEEGLLTEGYSVSLKPTIASSIDSLAGVNSVALYAAKAANLTVGKIDYLENGGTLTVDFVDYTLGDAAQANLFTVAGGINNFLQYTTPEEGDAYSRTKIATRNNADNLMAYYNEDTKSIVVVKRANAGILDANANNSVNGTTRVVDGVSNTLVYGFNISESLSGLVSGMSDGDILIVDGANRDLMVENKDLNAVITNSRIGSIQLGKTNNAGRSGNVSVEITASTITGRSALAGRGTASDSAATRTTLLVGVLDEETGERVGSYDFTLKGGAYNDSGSTDNVLCITQYANMTGDTVNVNLEDYTISCDIHMFDNIWNVEGQKLNQVNVSMKNVTSTASKWMWIWDPREANTTSINFTIENSSFVSGNRDYTLGLFGDNTENYGGEANVFINGFTMTGRLSGARGLNNGDVDVAYTSDAKVTLHVAGSNNIDLVKMFKEIEVAEDGLLTGATISLPENNTGFILRGTAGYDDGAKEFVVAGTTVTGASEAKFLDAEDNEIAGYKAVVGSTNVFVYKPETGDVYYSSQYNNNVTGTAVTDLDGTKSFLVYGDNAVSRLADAYTALEAATRVNPGFHVEYASTKDLYTKGYTTVVNGGAITNLYGGNAPDVTDPENPVAAEAVASVDITVNKGVSVTNLTVANELSGVTGNATITITDDVAIRGAIDGGAAYVGGTSNLVFTGAATAGSIVGFTTVTVNANEVVSLTGAFSGAAITIDATDFADFSKKVMTATSFGDVAPAVTIINQGSNTFGYQIVDDGEGKALLITSDLVKDTYANADWTSTTALGFVDETALVWDQNAFNSAAAAAAAVGEGNVLNIEGGVFSTEEAVTLANNNDVLIKADTTIGALTTGGKVSVSKALTATSISGSTALSMSAGSAFTVTEGIALADKATITIDVTDFKQTADDTVVISTGTGITVGEAALTDAAITVTGTGAGSYHAYYSTEDSSIHLLRLNTFYLDSGFEGGTNIPEFSPYTGEKLIYNVNAFDRMNASGAKMVDGQKFWATHRNGSIHTGGPDMAEGEVGKFLSEVHVVESNVDRIVLGGTNGNLEYTGDVHVFIDKSTICTVTDNDSWLFSNVTADNPWNNRNTITGSFTVDITASTIGTADGNASPLRIMNYTLVKDVEATETTEAKKSSVNVNIKDSVVYNDIRFIGDSPMGGQDFSVMNITLDNVTVAANRGWAIRGGGTGTRVIEGTDATDPLNASTVTVTIKDSTFGNNTRFAIEDNWNAGGTPWESPMCASDFVFDLTNVTINGALIAGRRDMGDNTDADQDPELPNYTGDRVLTVNGSNYVKNALWFKTVNLTGDSSLQGDTLRLFSSDSKINVDLTGYEGPSRVIVALNFQYDDDGNIIGGGIENFDATKTLVVTGLVEPAEGEDPAYTVLTDFAENGAVSKIVVKGGIKDVFVSSLYNEDDFEFGTAYKTGEAMFYGENAFSTIEGYEDPDTGELVPGALTSLAIAGTVLHVTGGAIETETLLNNSITIDANATLAYQGNTTITVDGTIQNNGNFVIDASGFVVGSPDRVTVLVADEILGNDIRVTTKAYAVEKALNELTGKTEISLVLKAAEVFVNTAWVGDEYQPGTEVVVDDTTAFIGYTAFASADAAATKVNSDGTIKVLGSTVAFTNAIARGITLVVDGTSKLLNTTIGSDTDGALVLQAGAIASGINVSGKSSMTVEAGATVTGGLGMSTNANVSFAAGSTLDFYIVGQSALEGARVTNLSSIGESAPTFTVTIDAGIKDGTYKLATGAAGFDSNITLQTEAASFIDLTIGNRVLVDEFGAYFEIGLTDNNELVLKKEASQDVIFVNSTWTEGETYTVGDVTVVVGENGFTTGDAAAAKAVSSGASTIKVVGGVASFTDGIVITTLVQSGAELADTDVTGTLTVSTGATLTGKATFAPAEGKTITVDGTIVFDTANASATEAQFVGLSNVLGNTVYTLTVSGEVASGDSFLLATGAEGFASTVALTGSDIVLTVGETQKVGNLGYTLTLTEGNLALNISDKPVPTLVYVNSTWTAADGETVQIDDQTTATMGYDAFKFGNAAYAGVTADGAIIVLAGEVSFSSDIAKTLTVNDGATLTGNAVITTAITVDGTIAFDTQYAANGAQITGLSYVSGATKYTLAAAATAGTWTLATDAIGFESDIAFGNYTLKLGEELVIDDYSYTVYLFGDNNTDLVLSVAKIEPPAPDTPTQAYVNSEWTGLADGTIVTVAGGTAKMGYDAFATLNGGIAGVTDDGSVNVVGGTVSFSEGYYKTITVDAAATVVGTASFENRPITINGTMEFDVALTSRTAAQFAFVHFISGDTKYTLVDETPAEGTYTLASGLWYDAASQPVFTGTVTFGDVELALNQAVQVGDFVYTLGTTGNMELTLKVTKYVAPTGVPSFFTGKFDGQQAMFAREIESNVKFYDTTATEWGKLALGDGWSFAGVGDFNNDGMDDVLRLHTSGLVVSDLSNGDGTFTESILNFKNAAWDILGTGDFNGDGKDDVLVANSTAASSTVGLLGYWANGTDWTLINGYSDEWTMVDTGDYDGNGCCDMLWKNSFVGEGGGTYNAYCTWRLGDLGGGVDWSIVMVAKVNETETPDTDAWSYLTTGDFNADGIADIAMVNDVGTVAIATMADTGISSTWTILSSVDTNEWHLVGTDDFNGDGTDDIAWCNSQGLAGYWQINDKQMTAWQNIGWLA